MQARRNSLLGTNLQPFFVKIIVISFLLTIGLPRRDNSFSNGFIKTV